MRLPCIAISTCLLNAAPLLAVVVGDPNGTPPDSPANHVDANTVNSPYAGVGSIFVNTGSGGFLGTGALISPWHVLTAGHMIDTNNNGTIDHLPGNVSFILNFGGNQTHVLASAALTLHPNFTGLNNPNLNDDLAILTLASPAPDGVPIYPLLRNALALNTTVDFVGYGQTGDGVNGLLANSQSFTTKRIGSNAANTFLNDDEGSGAKEIYRFDFDGNGLGFVGGGTLGNAIEATIGPGDSGAPAFVTIDNEMYLAGVSTFGIAGIRTYPFFGSAGGGMLVPAYVPWIDSVTGLPEPTCLAPMLVMSWILSRRRRTNVE